MSKRKPRIAEPKPSRPTIWERFGIKHLSPSQLANFADDPGVWYAKSRAKVFTDAGPAAWRGDAVEFGLYSALMGHDDRTALLDALRTYDHRYDEHLKESGGVVPDQIDERRLEIRPALERAIQAVRALDLPAPDAYQPWVEAFLPGLNVPVRGRPDFCVTTRQPIVLRKPEGAAPDVLAPGSKVTIDLKSTSQIPSENQGPKPEHKMAAAIYAHARGEGWTAILYASTAGAPKIPSRLFWLGPDDIKRQVWLASQIAWRLEWTLKAARALAATAKKDQELMLAQACRPNVAAMGGGVFRLWDDDFHARAVAAVPAWGR